MINLFSEENRKKIGLVSAPLLAILTYLYPFNLNTNAHILLAIMVFAIIFWFAEVIPLSMTALLGVSLAVLFGLTSVKAAFASLGNPIVLLFIGSFLIAQSMTNHKLDKRFALNLLSKDFFLKSPIRVILGFSLISFTLSMWISNTATTAMLFPLTIGIITMLKEHNIKNAKSFYVLILLSIAYSSSIGGVSTLIGTPTNLAVVEFLQDAGYNIDFLKWFLIAFPVSITMYIILIFYIKLNIKDFNFDKERIKNVLVAEKEKLTKWTAGEKNTMYVFLGAVILWILPGIANILGAKELYSFLQSNLHESIVALLAGISLFLIPVNFKKFEGTLKVEDIRKIDWDTVLLFGGGIALGKLIIKTGLADAIGYKVASLISPQYTFLLIIIIVVSMIFITEVSSNTATIISFAPILIGILKELNVDLFYPVVGAIIATSFAFMLPIATPPNAIVYGSRLVPITKMVKIGFLLNIIGSIVISVFIYFYMN
jgi:sodium-dependent dicarboxylate transporter 2/3/5